MSSTDQSGLVLDGLAPLTPYEGPLDDPAALQSAVEEHGYLYLPGFLPREQVVAARSRIAAHLADHGAAPGDGSLRRIADRSPPTMGFTGLPQEPELLAVLEHDRLWRLYECLWGEPVATYAFKWLRAVPGGSHTGAHMDQVYMGAGGARLMTAWIPFGDYQPSEGVLALVPASQRLPTLERVRATYGRMDVDRDRIEGWFSHDLAEPAQRYDLQWHASPVQMGDVITFGMHLLHGSTANNGPDWRLSCDVRFQPVADPMDPRWAPDGTGHQTLHDPDQEPEPMVQARQRWGV